MALLIPKSFQSFQSRDAHTSHAYLENDNKPDQLAREINRQIGK